MDGNTIRLLVFVSVFLMMLILESLIPRHSTVDSKPRRLGIHLSLSCLNTLLLKLVFGAAAVGAATTIVALQQLLELKVGVCLTF